MLMKTDYFIEKKFEIYRDAMTRTRWFLLMLVFFSCNALVFSILEEGSTSKSQLELINGYRLKHKIEHETTSPFELERWLLKYPEKKEGLNDSIYKNEIDQWVNSYPNKKEISKVLEKYKGNDRYFKELYEDKLKEFSKDTFKIIKTNNTISNSRMEKINIPYVGLSIEPNDYLPIIISIILIMILGTWINIQSLRYIVSNITNINDKDFNELIRLNFTFTGFHGTLGLHVSTLLQYIFFLFPALVIVICFYLDFNDIIDQVNFRNVISSSKEGLGGSSKSLTNRFIILAILSIISWIFSFLIVRKIRRIDKAFF
jgi:hypothetical protein